MIKRRGKNRDYRWVQVDSRLRDITDIILKHHSGMRLFITAFDSGPLKPNEEEIADGWKADSNCMISPELTDEIEIPMCYYDEWLILEEIRDFPKSEIFVNYGGFTLVDPQQLEAEGDPTWERDGYHWLYPIQKRFWEFIGDVDPMSYIGDGDNLNIVSKNVDFINDLKENA